MSGGIQVSFIDLAAFSSEIDRVHCVLVMLFLVPQGQFQKHLHTLANIAKLLHKKDFRQALEEAPDAAAMYKIIKEFGGK